MNQKEKIEELEKRIKELEQRPIYIPYLPPPQIQQTRNCPYCGLPYEWCNGHTIC